jgi:hypothetical protein
MTTLTENQEKIIDGVEEAILKSLQAYKKGERFDIDSLHALYEGIRIMHHIIQMRAQSHLNPLVNIGGDGGESTI